MPTCTLFVPRRNVQAVEPFADVRLSIFATFCIESNRRVPCLVVGGDTTQREKLAHYKSDEA